MANNIQLSVPSSPALESVSLSAEDVGAANADIVGFGDNAGPQMISNSYSLALIPSLVSVSLHRALLGT